jgi:hypothetical protein
MAVRNVTLTLPDGKTKVVVQGVTAGATFSGLRRYVNRMYKLEGSFALVVGGAARPDDDLIDGDSVSVVYTEGIPDRLLQLIFVMSQAAVVLIARGRRNWEVLVAAAVGFAGLPRSGPLGRIQLR